MWKFVAICLSLTLLGGCATTANYEKILNSWVGSSELDLIRQWGPPAQAYETSGRKFIVYQSSSNMYIPGTDPTYTTTLVGNTAYTTSSGGTPSRNIDLSCQTTFEISGNEIVSWQWQGNDCTAFE